jgi:4-hydroxy-2-oxoglutarate aldolase
MLLEGLHIPLTTPFHPDGRLNPRKLAANILRYSKSPAAGLIVLGPSGEPTLLSDDETREVLRTAAEAAAPEKVLIAGIARDSVHATLDLITYAAKQKYDAVLIGFTPVAANNTESLTWIHTVADRSPLPLVIVSTDRDTINADTVADFAGHPNIIGLCITQSDAAIPLILARTSAIRRQVTVTSTFAAVTARMQQAANMTTNFISPESLTGTATAAAEPPSVPALRTRAKSVGFQIIAAYTATMLADLRAGAVGFAPAFAACAPQASYEVFAAWKDSDQPLADEKQLRLIEPASLAEAAPGSLKYACDLNGYFGGQPRLPHLPPTGAERAELERHMKPLRT